MNILILGGAGKIGSALAESLTSSKQYNVRVVDNLSSGKMDNIRHLCSRPNFDFFLGHVCDPAFLEVVMADRDVIINSIKPISYETAVFDLVVGTQNVLELLDESQQYIHLSPFSLEPLDVISAAALSAEVIAISYNKQFGRNTVVLKLPTFSLPGLTTSICSVVKNRLNGACGIFVIDEVAQFETDNPTN